MANNTLKKSSTKKIKIKKSKNHNSGLFLENSLRRLSWFFSKSGVLALAFEHFFAMVPATILVPLLVNKSVGETVVDVSLVLFTSGVGTIFFIIFSKGKIPTYLGSSFAYIGLTEYLLENQINAGVSTEYVFSYVSWAYIFSALLLLALSLLYNIKGFERCLSFLLPATVVGPAISLIGLELSDNAVVHSGFDPVAGAVDSKAILISLVTLCVIIIFSITRHKIFKNMAIVVGIVVGYVLYCILYGSPLNWNNEIQRISIPEFNIIKILPPANWLNLLISVIPATLIVHTENIGRVTVINRMTVNEDNRGSLFTAKLMKTLKTSLLSQSISSALCSIIGSVPNTMYAENIAVMEIHKNRKDHKESDPIIKELVNPYSVIPFMLAGIIAIFFSFSGDLQHFLENLPDPVIGGMEFFLFGIISAPGIQLLVDQRVNYNKISNQIITASVLIAGIGGLSINIFDIVKLEGMSLGFAVGVSLNLIIHGLKFFGNTSDAIFFDELLFDCISCLSSKSEFKITDFSSSNENELALLKDITLDDLKTILRSTDGIISAKDTRVTAEYIREIITRIGNESSAKVTISICKSAGWTECIVIRKTVNGFFVDIKIGELSPIFINNYVNDYPDAIDIDGEFLKIDVSKNIPPRKIRKLIKYIKS